MIRFCTTAALCCAASIAIAQEPTASASLSGLDGASHGSVTLTQTPNGILLRAEIEGVPAGAHGFHIHETGACDATEGFMSAGGHFAGVSDTHGILVPGGPHSGDMPNIHVPESGALTAEVLNTLVSLDEDGDGYLMDEDGSAILIHAGADDYVSQPSGAAGDRIACGVIEMN